MMASTSFLGNLAGKVALITGASSGIGAATAVQFARQGIRLGLHGRSLERLQEVQKECEKNGLGQEDVILLPGELTNPKDMEKVAKSILDKFGTVHVLVNNAGTATAGDLSTVTFEQMDRMFHEHVKAPLQLTQLLWQALIENKGSIVNVSSIGGMVGVPGFNAYGIAKAAMTQLGRALNTELVGKGVRVNTISPGAVGTPFLYTSGMAASAEEGKQLLETFSDATLLKRIGSPEEIAGMILFLVSDACPFMIGQNIVVDGGATDKISISLPQEDEQK